MNSSQAIEKIKAIGIVPIVRATSEDAAVQAAEAIGEGGIPCVEITMTVPGALQALEQVAKRFGSKVLLGAGTVLDPETARACLSAGAEFFVTPSLNLRTIEFARRYSKAIFPGALTPTEIVAAWEAGADGIKVFPCSALGGAKYIKALRGPFPQIDFVPTGGVNLDTLAEFVRAGCSAVGVSGELVDAEAMKAGKYDVIRERARQFRERIDEAREVGLKRSAD
ncbi:MAG TPA: bifunctional 4-hydroxy-2-oxoglutarate aldolase/2-dehydro-3-deoxy-phosphogluconate aldolase [Bryobacteraceae bacterium]|nr:bifunctional 4-hydroxy-2-oxoglutarate aldolase/2-dehydro-3-deoxy-phosphogluconate aldolase [Bryobacteraceae bacterium]